MYFQLWSAVIIIFLFKKVFPLLCLFITFSLLSGFCVSRWQKYPKSIVWDLSKKIYIHPYIYQSLSHWNEIACWCCLFIYLFLYFSAGRRKTFFNPNALSLDEGFSFSVRPAGLDQSCVDDDGRVLMCKKKKKINSLYLFSEINLTIKYHYWDILAE